MGKNVLTGVFGHKNKTLNSRRDGMASIGHYFGHPSPSCNMTSVTPNFMRVYEATALCKKTSVNNYVAVNSEHILISKPLKILSLKLHKNKGYW